MLAEKLDQTEKTLKAERQVCSELRERDELRLRKLAAAGRLPDDGNPDSDAILRQSRRERTAEYAVELCRKELARADADIAAAQKQLVVAWEDFGVLGLHGVRAQMREAASRYKDLYSIQMAWLCVDPFGAHRMQLSSGTIVNPNTGEEVRRQIFFAQQATITDPETGERVLTPHMWGSHDWWKTASGSAAADLYSRLSALLQEVRKATEPQ